MIAVASLPRFPRRRYRPSWPLEFHCRNGTAQTTTIRLTKIPGICVAPQYVAEGLLKAEGFTEIKYVEMEAADVHAAFAAAKVDVVHGVRHAVHHAGGCWRAGRIARRHPRRMLRTFGTERVRAIHDLKGSTVSVPGLTSPHYLFLASIAAHVGIDPKRDIKFVIYPAAELMQLLAEKKIDALIGFPPVPQELREKKIGHVIVNSGLDRPWSQYFCCIPAAHREFVRKHPMATKRALRAIVKAANFCAAEPERAARMVADKGYRYDYSLQMMNEIQYTRWRDYDAEDTVRFYSLRLREVGMIKSTPSKIIADGTDWRFLNELKRELKG